MRWGYHTAATLSAWTLTADTTGMTLVATSTDADAFKVTQHPLTLVVSRQNGQPWIWPLESLHLAGSTVTGRVAVQKE